MLKRSTDDAMSGDDQISGSEPDPLLKRRKVQFEAVRLPAVSNVNDMKGRTLAVQAAKLRQMVIQRNHRIETLTEDLERAKTRQKVDEANFLKIFNVFSEIEKFICWQTKSEFGSYEGSDDAPTAITVQGMLGEQIFDAYQAKMRNNLENAFLSYSKAREDRCAEVTRALKNIRALCDDPRGAGEAINRELAAQAVQLAEQNEKLMAQNTTRQNEAYNSDRKRRQLADKLEVAHARADELASKLEDAWFKRDQAYRVALKLETRLVLIDEGFQSANDYNVGVAAVTTSASSENQRKSVAPVTPPQEVSSKELENLRVERDDQAELASRRLQEINDLKNRIQAIAVDNTKLKCDLQKSSVLTLEQIQNSEEYKNLKNYYSMLIKEYERLKAELSETVEERDKCKKLETQRFYQMQEEQDKTLQEIRKESTAFKLFYDTTHDVEILRTEFDIAAQEASKQSKQVEWDEMKGSMNELRHYNNTLRAEVKRLRAKHKAAREEISSLKEEMNEMKTKQENCLIVQLVHPSEVPADSTSDIQTLRAEKQSLIQQVQKLGLADKKIRQEMVQFVQKEVEKRIGDKLKEIEMLKQANETLTNDEQQISEEMEGIEERMAELQERNEQLRHEIRQLDERNLRVINDRMIQETHVQALSDRVNIAETRANTSDQVNQMTKFEKATLEKGFTDLNDLLTYKNSELARTTSLLETNRRMVAELGQSRDESQLKAERATAQVQKMESVCQSKTAESHEMCFQKNRVQEELDLLRKQYERSKRAEPQLADTGSDEVLKEANRQLKETLTCPSCKTRPKDCIMLKCYHLFCETCIKTMYDTRQRKCPKCNSNFGANDFHRVFI